MQASKKKAKNNKNQQKTSPFQPKRKGESGDDEASCMHCPAGERSQNFGKDALLRQKGPRVQSLCSSVCQSVCLPE